MVAPNQMALTVDAARAGNLTAFTKLVETTQEMAYAVAWQVLRQEPDARDAVQEAYLLAFKRLAELTRPDAFPGWLRRIVVTVSLNYRRRARVVWVPLNDLTAPAPWRGLVLSDEA
jgi:RNA polymerase sigma-70 factor (ECF subfamily)